MLKAELIKEKSKYGVRLVEIRWVVFHYGSVTNAVTFDATAGIVPILQVLQIMERTLPAECVRKGS